MKVLCIGDSLGMPREGCLEEEVWTSLLKQRYPDLMFIDEFKRARLVEDALACYRKQYKNYNADITILQLGIVDCSPRYINTHNKIVRLIFYLFDKLGKSDYLWRKVKSRPRRRSCVYTSPSKFRKVYSNLVKEILSADGILVIIKIGHGSEAVLKRSQYFNFNVDKYNNIIDGIVNQYKERVYCISPLKVVSEDYFVDGYHCCSKGMRIVYEELTKVLDSITVK